jgi:hypothetical protein
MEDAVEPSGLTVLDAERDDVLDLDLDVAAGAQDVASPLLHDLHAQPLDGELLPDERRERSHGTTPLAAEHREERLCLRVARARPRARPAGSCRRSSSSAP